MNLAFALSGGAARGAFHLGVLHYCEENNININAYSGSSIGSVIACSHGSGITAKEQLKIFSSKELKKVFKFNYFKYGLLQIDSSQKIINELLPIPNLEDIPKPVFINAYDIKEKKLHYFNKGSTLNLCIASCAIIPLFKPIKYGDMYLIDGGLFDNIPIKPLENKNYDIFSIDLFPKNKATQKAIINPIKTIKRKLFTQLYQNNKYTIENTNYYLGSNEIRDFKLYSFKELEECFSLGIKEARKHFLDILK